MHPYGLIFVFSVEMGFHHVGQATLELLTSASQNVGITGISHHTWPYYSLLEDNLAILIKILNEYDL